MNGAIKDRIYRARSFCRRSVKIPYHTIAANVRRTKERIYNWNEPFRTFDAKAPNNARRYRNELSDPSIRKWRIANEIFAAAAAAAAADIRSRSRFCERVDEQSAENRSYGCRLPWTDVKGASGLMVKAGEHARRDVRTACVYAWASRDSIALTADVDKRSFADLVMLRDVFRDVLQLLHAKLVPAGHCHTFACNDRQACFLALLRPY